MQKPKAWILSVRMTAREQKELERIRKRRKMDSVSDLVRDELRQIIKVEENLRTAGAAGK